MGLNPILALQAALGIVTAVFVGGWAAAVAAIRRAPQAPIVPATDARAGWNRHRYWRTHQFLRHARHRLVRDDDGDLSRASRSSRTGSSPAR